MNYLEIESVVGREILDSRRRHCGTRLRTFRRIHW